MSNKKCAQLSCTVSVNILSVIRVTTCCIHSYSSRFIYRQIYGYWYQTTTKHTKRKTCAYFVVETVSKKCWTNTTLSERTRKLLLLHLSLRYPCVEQLWLESYIIQTCIGLLPLLISILSTFWPYHYYVQPYTNSAPLKELNGQNGYFGNPRHIIYRGFEICSTIRFYHWTLS